MTTSRRARILAGVALTGALVASGCAPGSSAAGGGSETTASGGVSTAVPSEDATLTLAFTDAPDMTKALVEAFHEKYPQITITTQYTQFNDYVKALKLSMSSDSAPDIAQYNAALKDLSSAGLVVDLSGYEKAYGWDDSFPKSALDELRVDDTGKVLGTGRLVAVPGGLSLVGLYYNKKLLEQAGIDAPPTTIDELEQDLAAAEAKGLDGLAVGGLDTGSLHLWSSLMNSMVDPSVLRSWIEGKPGSNIVTDDAVAATQTFADWSAKGYYMDGTNGTSENDSATAFSKGRSVFTVNGNWAAAQLDQAMGDDVGFVVFPPEASGGKAVGNGFSVSYMISSKSKHQAAAAAFLDFLQDADAAAIESDGGFLPPNAEAAPKTTGVKADLTTANQKVVGDDGLMPFPDFAAPAMLDKLTSGLQQVSAGRMSPKDFLTSLQDVWDAYHQG